MSSTYTIYLDYSICEDDCIISPYGGILSGKLKPYTIEVTSNE